MNQPSPRPLALDRLDLIVVVDNETDSLSSIGPGIPQTPEILGHLGRVEPTTGPGGHQCYQVFDHMCVACHGADAHLIGDGLILASGHIARVTEHETGLAGHHSIRNGQLVADPLILDERYIAAEVSGRGVTILSACSHAGIVNACVDAMTAFPGTPVDLVLGGYHLGGPGMQARIGDTVRDLVELVKPTTVAPGHCTGWRAKTELQQAFPGRYGPSVVGSNYALAATPG